MRFLQAAEIRKARQVSHGVLGGFLPELLLLVLPHFKPTRIDGGRLDFRQHDVRIVRIVAWSGSFTRYFHRLRGRFSNHRERHSPLDHTLGLTNRNDAFIVAGGKFGALQIDQIGELLGLPAESVIVSAGELAVGAIVLARERTFELQRQTGHHASLSQDFHAHVKRRAVDIRIQPQIDLQVNRLFRAEDRVEHGR